MLGVLLAYFTSSSWRFSLSRLAGQCAPEPLSLPSQCWGYRCVPLDLASSVGVVVLNSSPQVYTSTTEPSPQPVAGDLTDKVLSSSCGPCTIYVLVFLVIVCGVGDRAQGLVHAGQVLYC